MKRRTWALTLLLGGVLCLLLVYHYPKLDWYSFGSAQLPLDTRSVPKSGSVLHTLSVDGTDVVGRNVVEVRAGTTVTLTGRVKLESTSYRWRKMPPTKDKRFPFHIPMLAIRHQLIRRASHGEKVVAKRATSILDHKKGVIEWSTKLNLPSTSGEYRFTLDEIEYNEVYNVGKPLAERELLTIRFVVSKANPSQTGG